MNYMRPALKTNAPANRVFNEDLRREKRKDWQEETSLQDLLDDPVTHVIMRHDGVTREDILALVAAHKDSNLQA